ncbi:MAG TPA: hypothetical protein VG817_11980 [Gemmatimonadales bacterium]|nr:hypothetical protein [Gemmatimonadales bacterium]
MRLHTSLVIGAALLTLVACGKKDATPKPDATAAAPAPPPPQPLAIASVDLGKSVGADKKVGAPLTTFGTRDTIYASVTTSGVGESANLSAKWSFVKADQSLVPVNETSQMVAGSASTTEFHIDKKTAWPKGNYRVEVKLNDGVPVTKDFTIQ